VLRQREGLLRQRPPGRGLPRARALVGPGARRQRRAEGGAGPVQEPHGPGCQVQRGALPDRDGGQAARRGHEPPRPPHRDHREPARWWVQVPDGNGGWKAVPDQFKNPTVPAAKFNEALFQTVTSDKLRVAFTNNPGRYTAIAEIQVFDTGREVPPVSNEAPVVTAARDASADGNLSTRLVATASDDGIP